MSGKRSVIGSLGGKLAPGARAQAFIDHRWVSYLIAVVLTVTTFFIRLALSAWIGSDRPVLILFEIPIVISAYLGGMGPALLSTFLIAMGLPYFVLPLTSTLVIARSVDLLQWTIAVICGALISIMSGMLHTSRKRAEANERLQATTISSIGDGLISIDAEGRIRFLNKEASRLTGWTCEEAAGQPVQTVFRVVNEQTGEPLDDTVAQVLREGRTVPLANHASLVTRDGQTVPVEDSAAPILDSAGHVIGVVLVFHDVTAKRRAEQALLESQKDLNRAQAMGKIGSWRMNVQQNELLCSDESHHIFGTSKGAPLTYETLLSTVHPDDRNDVSEKWAAALQGEPFDVEHRIVVDGVVKWVSQKAELVFDSQRALLGGFGAAQDITERKRAEQTIKESEERLRLVLEGTSDGIWDWNPQTGQAFFSPRCYTMMGYEPDEFPASYESWRQLAHPEDLEQAERVIRQAIEEKVSFSVELRFRAKHGEWRWILGRGKVAELNAAGQPVRVVGSHSDTTERKRAEEELRASERHFRTLVETAPDAIFIHAGGSFTYVNKAAADLFGATSRVELIGTPVMNRIHPDYREIIHERMRLLTQESTPVPKLEHQYLRLDGSLVDVQASGVPFRYEGNEGALVFVRNITDQKVAENALLASEAKYKELFQQFNAVLEAIPDRLSFIDKDFRTLWANRIAVESMVSEDGYSSGGYCYELWHRQTQPCENCFLPAVTTSGEPSTEILSEPGGKIWEYRFIPIKDDAGKVSSIVRLGRDITEHRSLEAQLRQAQKLEAIGTLAGGIAHDFNNILAPIIGYTEMVIGDLPIASSMTTDLEQVLHAAHRARDLVKQILAFSRQGSDQARMPIDISSIVKEALKLLRASLPTSIEIRENIRRGVVLADATQIHQVLVNLCTNASHAMNEKGVLGVGLSNIELGKDELASLSLPDLKPGRFVRLSVSDTGHGMDAETMHRIFDPYFTTKAVGKGTGLGLAVVHGIVVRHEGGISVRSEVGKGTTFTIYLPAMELGLEVSDKKEQALPEGTERILWVDDEQALAEMGSRMLARLGYAVTFRTNALDALELFRMNAHQFDLIVSDYTMPQMTGLELASEILKIRSDMPIILSTGYSEKATEETAQKLGIRGFAMKPLDRSQLAELVRSVLDGRKD